MSPVGADFGTTDGSGTPQGQAPGGRPLVAIVMGSDSDWAVMQAAADALVDPARAADWTHALMDLGATVCRPARPACDACPIRAWCAFAGMAEATAPSNAAPPVSGTAAARPPVQARRPRLSRSGAVPFEATTRWLRGRIVDRLCRLPRGTRLAFEGSLGVHGPEAVAAALVALAADGLVELDAMGAARLAGEGA